MSRKLLIALIGAAAIGGVLNFTSDGSSEARAAICCIHYDMLDFTISGSTYSSLGEVGFVAGGGDLEAILKNLGLLGRLGSPGNVPLPPPGTTSFGHGFFDVFADLLLDDGGTGHIDMFFDITYRIDGAPGDAFGGEWSTELLSLELNGTANTSGGPVPVMIRESPTLPSLGTHHIIPAPDGSRTLDSFFDVFFELSLDGGFTWRQAEGPMRLAVTAVPEPAAILIALVGLTGWGCTLRRRKESN